ncbi:MAG: hypothetical protein Q9216_004554 [Gyalolechia sp. 2 TL-2023]
MPRRSHKKSRGGCTQCKKRHVKCDESKPQCINCTTGELQCQYLLKPQARIGHAIATPDANGAHSPAMSSPGTLDDGRGDVPVVSISPPVEARSDLVDIGSIELLHHWYTVTHLTMTPDPDQQEMWKNTAVKYGLSYPFLLHEILALTALHKAMNEPERQDFYLTRATKLQSDALQRFRDVKRTDESNCIPVFLFSSLLGVHLLADRSRTQGLNFGDYLDHILGCISILRSVMNMVLREWMPYFKASDISPLIRSPNPQAPYDSIPRECHSLNTLIGESDLGPSSVKAYTAAIDRLFWLFAITEVPSVTHDTARWAIGWPVQLPDEYITLLNQRRPEALIILAYYGVVLHFYRKSWTIGGTGASLIRAVSAQLGSFWERWLAWPLQIIDSR